jgi:hypothetical protein
MPRSLCRLNARTRQSARFHCKILEISYLRWDANRGGKFNQLENATTSRGPYEMPQFVGGALSFIKMRSAAPRGSS